LGPALAQLALLPLLPFHGVDEEGAERDGFAIFGRQKGDLK
jgi:hypothetical protein